MNAGSTDIPDLAVALRGVKGGIARAFVIPELRVFFMSMNKNACTSLQWMMADLAGEDLAGFSCGTGTQVTAHDAIHDRKQWKVVRRLPKLDPRIRADIHPENGWFVFAVVRDPRLRFFSAWQNKILLDFPGYAPWRSSAWYPRHPVSTASVVEDFAAFVAFMADNPDHVLRTEDGHFLSQVTMLGESVVPYSRIYELSEIGQLRADLVAHLEALGHRRALYLPHANHTPLHPLGALFGDGIREVLEQMYRDDFDRFGERWDFTRTLSAPGWTSQQLAEVDMVAAFSRRQTELLTIVRREQERADAAEARLRQAETDLLRERAAADRGLLGKLRVARSGRRT